MKVTDNSQTTSRNNTYPLAATTSPPSNKDHSQKTPLLAASLRAAHISAEPFGHELPDEYRGIRHWLASFSGCQNSDRQHGMTEIIDKGRAIRLQAEAAAAQQAEQHQMIDNPPHHGGWKAAAVLLFAGLGAGAAGALAWSRFRAGDNTAAGSQPGAGATAPESAAIYQPESGQPPTTSTIASDRVIIRPLKNCYWAKPSRGLVLPKPVRCEPPRKRYAYTDKQPPECLSARFRQRCELAHARARNVAGGRIMSAGKTRCFCPPPSRGRFLIVQPSVTLPWAARPSTSAPSSTSPSTTTLPSTTANITKAPAGAILHVYRGNKYLISPAGEPAVAGPQPIGTQPPDEAPAVRMEKLYDFSCIEAREQLSWADIIRQIGKTLREPISRLAEESQVIHHHNTLGKSCPDAEKSQRLITIGEKVDYSFTTIMNLLPGANPISVAQLILGPAMELTADSMEGKEANLVDVGDLNSQILFLFKNAMNTLNPAELSALFTGSGSESLPAAPSETDMIAKRFRMHNKHAWITISGREYLLKESGSAIPFVEDNGYSRPVIYNQKQERWEFVDQSNNFKYAPELLKNKYVYGISLRELSGQASLEIHPDGNDGSQVRIRNSENRELSGIIIDEMLIPTDAKEIDGDTVIMTQSRQNQEKRVLINTDYGWIFEPPSVATGKYLNLLLESKDTGLTCHAEQAFTAVRANGLCYNHQGEAFIKHDYQYYPVQPLAPDNVYTLPDHPGSLLLWKNNQFFLTSATAMLFPFKHVSAGSVAFGQHGYLKIEAEAEIYLRENGEQTPHPVQRNIGPGLYVDSSGTTVLMVGGKNYQVIRHQHNEISIQRKLHQDRWQPINLWLDHNLYLRVRDELPEVKGRYIEVFNCRFARSPGHTGNCVPLMIEEALDKALSAAIRNRKTSNKSVMDKNLSQVSTFGISSVLVDTTSLKYYFLYKGHLFEAQQVDTWFDNQPGDIHALKLSAKSNFFSRAPQIATIIIQRNAQQVEIKKEETFLAEKLNIGNRIATNYINSRPYQRIIGMDSLEEAVNQVQLSGAEFITKMQAVDAPPLAEQALLSWVGQQLYPQEISGNADYQLRIVALNEDPDALPPYMQNVQSMFKCSLDFLKNYLLNSVMEFLDVYGELFYDRGANAYLARTFHASRADFINKFSASLFKRLSKVYSFLKTSNIKMVTIIAADEKNADEVNRLLNLSERPEGRVACSTPGKQGEIYINVDKLGQTGSQLKLSDGDVVSLLLRHGFRSATAAGDSLYVPFIDGDYLPVTDALQSITTGILSGHIPNEEAFRQLSREYLENVVVYRDKSDALLTNDKLAYLAENDPAYLAHLMLNSADMLTLLSLDLYELFLAEVHSIYANDFSQSKAEMHTEYRQYGKVVARGSIGTIYDLHDGYLIKDYSGIVTPGNKSRLRAAMNNAGAMNRLYGPHSATIMLNPSTDESATVSVKMRKIPGVQIAKITRINDAIQLDFYRTAVKRFINKENNPAIMLAETLKQHGLHHQDINDANLLFDPTQGFSLIDFDATDIKPEGELLSEEVTHDMAMKLKLVMKRLGQYLAFDYDELLDDLGLARK